MNIFGLITIGLVATAVLLIYYVELPRLRRELVLRLRSLEGEDFKLGFRQAKILEDVEAIKSARGTFSRQLGELSSRLDAFSESAMWKFKDIEIRVRSIADIVDGNTDKIALVQVYLDSQKKPDKKKTVNKNKEK
jgi:hypothetical protein